MVDPLFDVQALRDEIVRTWGPAGGHIDVFDSLVKQVTRDGLRAHTWEQECRGLGWMILQIEERYRQAKTHLGGDSELLCSAITEAKKYVDGPLRDGLRLGTFPRPPVLPTPAPHWLRDRVSARLRAMLRSSIPRR